MNIKEKIIEASKILDELDDYQEQLSIFISDCDKKISDLYHFLELMTLDSKKCYRFCRELKKVLTERRKYKRDIALIQSYDMQKQKLIAGKDNRQMLLSSIHKVDKYTVSMNKSNIYTEEELTELIGE